MRQAASNGGGVDDCYLDAAGCLAESPAAVVADVFFAAGVSFGTSNCSRGRKMASNRYPATSNARPAVFASRAASLLAFTRIQCLSPTTAPLTVITLPSYRGTVATLALLRSTSPAGVTSSAVNPLHAVGEGASCTGSAAFRPGGTPSSVKLSSLLEAARLAPAAAGLAGAPAPEVVEARAPPVTLSAGPAPR